MTTTDKSRRRVRTAALAGTMLAGVGVAVAVGANPFPASDQPKDADVTALEQRERALAREARRVNDLNAERWASYRTQLAERQQQIAQAQAENAANQASYSAPQATYVPQAAPVAQSGSS